MPVTYFNKKDFVKFGNYLLSDERTDRLLDATDVFEEGWDEKLEIRSKQVSHADIKNFLEKIKKIE